VKRLALLLLALPLAACAIPTPEQRAQLKANQLADAETTCAARDVGPSDPRHLRCVNFSLRKYGMAANPLDNGSLVLVNAGPPFPAGPDGYSGPNGPADPNS
jgi:hypothetical protein